MASGTGIDVLDIAVVDSASAPSTHRSISMRMGMGYTSFAIGVLAMTSMGGLLAGPVAVLTGILAARSFGSERDRKFGKIGAWLGVAAFVLWSVVLVIFILTQ